MLAYTNGAMSTRVSAIVPENMLEMMMATAFARCMSTQLRVYGPCCAPGYALIEAFLKKNCPTIWDFLSLSTMPGDGAKLYLQAC